jgi:hypothetical protein
MSMGGGSLLQSGVVGGGGNRREKLLPLQVRVLFVSGPVGQGLRELSAQKDLGSDEEKAATSL